LGRQRSPFVINPLGAWQSTPASRNWNARMPSYTNFRKFFRIEAILHTVTDVKKEAVMRALTVEWKESLEELQRQAKQESQARMARRLRALVLLRQGWRPTAVAAATGGDLKSVESWVHRDNDGGVDALRDKPRPGRRPKLRDPQAFKQRVGAGATVERDGVSEFRGHDLQRMLAEECGALYSLSGTYAVLHRVGVSAICPRPTPPKGDPAAREAFKKTLPSSWPRLPKPIRAKNWKGGYRTRCAWDRKGPPRGYGRRPGRDLSARANRALRGYISLGPFALPPAWP
jgi:transposase